ncbi:MAG: GAF domain-containing protein, partial [Desulfocapsa sp.]|nr:GAF domain-containing protein [Desulfocapsa sp.]
MGTLQAVQNENTQLRTQLEEVQKKFDGCQTVLKQVIDFSSMLGVPDELKEVYRSGLGLFKDLLKMDIVNLFLVDDKLDNCVLCDTIGLPESMINKLVAHKGMDLPGCVLESRQLEIVEDFHNEKRFSIPDVILKNKITSAIGIPMVHNEKVFGVIVGNSCNKVTFSYEQKALAQVFANQLAVVIKNATHIQSLSVSEAQLKRRTAEVNSIFTNSMTGIMLLRGGRVLARCNRRFSDFMGYDSPEEMEGIGMREIHLSEERFRDFGGRYYDSLVSGEQIQVEY